MYLLKMIAVFTASTVFTTLALTKLVVNSFKHGLKVFSKPKWHPLPKYLMDSKLGTHKTAYLTNINLHYVESGDKNSPLMLFVHGFPEFWYSWREQILKFQDKYRVVAMDLRGYGGSDKPQDIASYCLPNLVNDIKMLIEQLGRKNCILVAHDWGGAIAWKFAAEHPEMVTKLIVMNCPHHNAFLPGVKRNKKQILKSGYIFQFQMPFVPEWLLSRNDFFFIETAFNGKGIGMKTRKMNNEELEAYKAVLGQPGALTAMINYYRAIIRYQVAPSRDQIKVPTLLLWGTKDAALSIELAEETRQFCDNLSLIYHDGISHWVQQDDAEKVNGNIEKFISS